MKIHFKTIFLICIFLILPSASRAGDDIEQKARLKMVKAQIEARGVNDAAVLKAMRTVPRHLFVPSAYRYAAYADHPLPIGYGQTISQPYIVAHMTEVLKLTGKEKVLEIGTGSGYQAAILSKTARDVFSIEIIPQLHASAEKRLERLDYKNVKLKLGDGYFGWPEHAPFDDIIVTAAAAHIPPPLIKQLKPGGRMNSTVGPAWSIQELVRVEKDAQGRVKTRSLMAVRFVPLVRDK